MDIIKSAQQKLKRDQEYWSEIYEKAKEDLHFLSDDPFAQWDEQDWTRRTQSGRPALTIDQLSQFVHQVANDIRMNTPTITCIPSKDASVEDAEIFKGIIRHIEYESSADDAYDYGSNCSIKCSIGFIRVDNGYSYEDEESDEQSLFIKRVVNPLAVWLDCDSIEPDGSDAKHGTIIDRITVGEFKRLYPKFSPVSFESDEKSESNLKDDDFISVAEFFILEEEEIEGQTRTYKKYKVKRYKLSGQDILDETTFPGKYIPIIPVYGEEAWINGKRHLFSLIRKSKAAQQMFNYWASLETELLMKAPKAPIIAVGGTIEAYTEDWKNPDKAMVLRYDQMDADGNPAPRPERLEAPTIPTGIVNARRQAVDDIKATMGIYNASLGQRSNEQSGVAIAQRQQEGDVATYHFGDNLVKSITHVGRVLVCAIPEVYDTPRILNIIGEEDEPKQIGVNGMIVEGQEKPIDLKKGKYGVKVVTGAPFTTRRQEAAQFYSDLVTRQPELMTVMGDLMFKNMDFAGSQAMAKRMEKVIDPKFLDEQQADPEKQMMAQQLEQMQQVILQGQQEMQALQAQLKDKQADLQLKAQSEMTDAQENQAKMEIQVLELQIKQQEFTQEMQLRQAELALKQRELDLKAQELQTRAQLDALAMQQRSNSFDNNTGAV